MVYDFLYDKCKGQFVATFFIKIIFLNIIVVYSSLFTKK